MSNSIEYSQIFSRHVHEYLSEFFNSWLAVEVGDRCSVGNYKNGLTQKTIINWRYKKWWFRGYYKRRNECQMHPINTTWSKNDYANVPTTDLETKDKYL